MTEWIAKVGKAVIVAGLLGLCLPPEANAQQLALQCDPTESVAKFTLGDVLHVVRGAFRLKSCDLHFDPSSGKVHGEIVFDARSGQSGNGGRDRKMHKDVLESVRYPEIAFRPERVDGKVTPTGTSSVQVHGMFFIHGGEHEITAPAEVNFEAEHWRVTSHFPVPYGKWGMKNPSVLFLRVGDSVDIDLLAGGAVKPEAP